MTDETQKNPRAAARRSKPRKARNNAARKAALNFQRENPGTKYTTARAHVAAQPAGAGYWWDAPCYSRLLDAYGLVLSDRVQVLARWARMCEDPANVAVPIGIADEAPARTVQLRFGAASRHFAFIPHMPGGEMDFAATAIAHALVTSILASCDRELLDIWLIGHRYDLQGDDYVRAYYEDSKALRASGPVDALWGSMVHYWPDPYYRNRPRGMLDWASYDRLDAELDRRHGILAAAAIADHQSWWADRASGDTSLPHLLVVTSCPRRPRDRDVLARALERGPALGVHILVIADSLTGDFWPPLSAWCDMVLTEPEITYGAVGVQVDANSSAAASHLVITPTSDRAADVVNYRPFIDTGNGLWLPVYGANDLHSGLPVISLAVGDEQVQVHLAAVRRSSSALPEATAAAVIAGLGDDVDALRALASLLVSGRSVSPADALQKALGSRQPVELTDVAVVGHPDDTALVVNHLVAQLPNDMAIATTTENDAGTRITKIPIDVSAPEVDRYLPLPPGRHRLIEARTVDDLPPLSSVHYLIDVYGGGEQIVVHHPEDDPRQRRVDITRATRARHTTSRRSDRQDPELLGDASSGGGQWN